MLEFEFSIVHHADIELQTADAMSRISSNSAYKTKLVDDIPEVAIPANMDIFDKKEQEQKSWENYKEPTEQ